ncbi:Zinc finger protein 441, partial [Eumeta japonica]
NVETRIKEEPKDEDENIDFYSDLPLECMLCTKAFKSISGLKAHVISQHSYKTVKRKSNSLNSPEKKTGRKHYCKVCNRSFVTSTDLMVHETCHNKAICYACNQQFNTFKELTKHRKNCNKIDANNTVKPKGLKDVKRVPIEIEVPIEDNKTIEPLSKLACPKCNEVFTGSYYLNIHQEIHHNSTIQRQVSISGNPIDLKQHDDLLLQSIFGVAK